MNPGAAFPGLVSILIPCFNAERWIAQAVDSALDQSWPQKEIVVVDDGSTDGSLAIIKGYGERIRWESGPNRGGNAARNRLLALARSEWLQYLDADDYLLPQKIARQVEYLSEHPETDVLFGPVTTEYWSANDVRRELLPIPEPHDPWILLARWFMPQTGAPLWRKQAIVDVGGWKVDQPCCQEHALYLALLMAEKRFSYCEHNGAVYRQWGDQTVCKRDIPEVHRRRLEIEARAAEHLRSRGELTCDRLHAINQARFETARVAWRYDEALAEGIMALIRDSEPGFVPDPGPAAPRRYRMALRLFGLAGAERLAKWARGLRPRSMA